jgi:DeoR/GlpR family transcriptional regulator of sugar metabolism
MDAPTRHRAILDALQAARQVEVGDLSERLGVSGMTIRRDLAELDRAGQLDRVHGGAVPRRAPAFGARATAMPAEKARIARAVAELVPSGAAVGIDSGTTCHAVATALAGRSELTVVTNSLHVAAELQGSGSRVLVLGGQLTPELTLVGPGATMPAVHLDLVVLGCGGIAPDRGVTYFDPAEVEVRRSLVAAADRVVLAADRTKVGRKKAMVLGGLDLVDVLVTDAEPGEPLRSALRAAGTTLVVAAPHPRSHG